MATAAQELKKKNRLDVLEQKVNKSVVSFSETLSKSGSTVKRNRVSTLQVNIGKLCNQACHHCHVESSPIRTENMSMQTVDRLLELVANTPAVHTIDITGGAPEMNPNFRYFVVNLRKLGKEVVVRCNLTVLFEPGQEDTPLFFKDQKVQIVASLPCYSKDNVDKQRGRGVFNKSVEALKILNGLGFGKKDSGLILDLVYNPVGAFLPPDQASLQADYKKTLMDDLGIEFNQLFTITNMPIKRFLEDLEKQDKLDEYMQLLLDSYNRTAADNVMCRDLISISYDGKIYDCDFNQMLEIPQANGVNDIWSIRSISDLDFKDFATANHCYGCTAGAGSSCGGATT
ncbi:MAG: arsenosugar biosynthesis radical SAM (seleno)protein ArsS [Bdellovibrionales bacterium]